jgi:hypothetical protein
MAGDAESNSRVRPRAASASQTSRRHPPPLRLRRRRRPLLPPLRPLRLRRQSPHRPLRRRRSPSWRRRAKGCGEYPRRTASPAWSLPYHAWHSSTGRDPSVQEQRCGSDCRLALAAPFLPPSDCFCLADFSPSSISASSSASFSSSFSSSSSLSSSSSSSPSFLASAFFCWALPPFCGAKTSSVNRHTSRS